MARLIKGLNSIASNLAMKKIVVLDLTLIDFSVAFPVKKVKGEYVANIDKLGNWLENEWFLDNFTELDKNAVDKLSRKTKRQLQESNVFIFPVGNKHFIATRKYDKYMKIIAPEKHEAQHQDVAK
jgi:hypothetical protein